MPNRIERRVALPVDLYGDQAIFEVEVADIWHRDWVFACPADAIAAPGMFVPVTIGRQPVIVVRGDDYEIRAVANVCSHRGAQLVECPGRGSRFSCRYHAWTYGLDGELASVPYAAAGEIDKGDHGLESFRVELWHGLVFVNLDPDAAALGARTDSIETYVKPLGLNRLHHDVSGVAAEKWDANWKVVYANALDTYSHFRVHPDTVEPVSPTDASYYLAGSAEATVTGGESGDRADHLVIALPPSFVAIVYPDLMLWQAFAPVAVDQTLVRIGVAAERIDAHGTPVNLPGWDPRFLDEDRVISERVQASASARWKPGQLLEVERALGDFHEYLACRLAGRSAQPPHYAARPGERPNPPDP